jgi:hypothetical protein
MGTSIENAEEVSIDVEVRDWHVFHEGLGFALPEI